MNFPGTDEYDRSNIEDRRATSAQDFEASYFAGLQPLLTFSVAYPTDESVQQVQGQINQVMTEQGAPVFYQKAPAEGLSGPSLAWLSPTIGLFTVVLGQGDFPSPLVLDTPPGQSVQQDYQSKGIFYIDAAQQLILVKLHAPDPLSADYLKAQLAAAFEPQAPPEQPPVLQQMPDYDTAVDLTPVDQPAPAQAPPEDGGDDQ